MRNGTEKDTYCARFVRHVWLVRTTHHEDCRATRPLIFLAIAGNAEVEHVPTECMSDYVVSLHCVAQSMQYPVHL